MNDDLAYEALDYIRANPEEWNQAAYFCGTAACFAGRVIRLNARNQERSLTADELADPGHEAAALLGWQWDDAATVFGCATREFSVLEERVKDVLNGEVKRENRSYVSSENYYATALARNF